MHEDAPCAPVFSHYLWIWCAEKGYGRRRIAASQEMRSTDFKSIREPDKIFYGERALMALASDRPPSRLRWFVVNMNGGPYRLVPESLSQTLADRDIGFVFRPFGLLDVYQRSSVIHWKNYRQLLKKNVRQEEYGLNIIEHKDISANVHLMSFLLLEGKIWNHFYI